MVWGTLFLVHGWQKLGVLGRYVFEPRRKRSSKIKGEKINILPIVL